MSEYAIIDKLDLQRMIGIPASVGVCEPIEGFVERPDFVLGCMRDMAEEFDELRQKLEQAGARRGKLENALIAIRNTATNAPFSHNMKWIVEHCEDALGGRNSSAWLLRKQAEAVESCELKLNKIPGAALWDLDQVQLWLDQEAGRLRQQADEIERSNEGNNSNENP